MKMKFLLAATALVATSIVLSLPGVADTTIVDNGKSTFTIVVPHKIPKHLDSAVKELQRDIEIATGAKLPVKTESENITSPVISLGDTAQTKAAGFSSSEMSEDSYRIVTQNGNIYILGVDTPDDGWASGAGTSRGTANGIYVFLEDYLDVRWLMPGDLGRDVPGKSTLTIADIDRSETPLFNYRRMPYLDSNSTHTQLAAINDWQDRQRIGKQAGPVAFSAGHNWWQTVNKAFGEGSSAESNTKAVQKLYEQHPDWFAMDAFGKRPLPKSKYEKFETTNPELVRWFAEQAIKSLKAQTRPYPYSLSPSDGGRWSQSPESKALYDPPIPNVVDPETPSGQPGTSSLVLKWYHDVAQIVAEEYPEGKVSGYIYSSFLYPPTKVDMKLPDNLVPQIAPSISYGYGLYRPETQKLFKEVMSAWAKVTPENWYYYDLPNVMLRQDSHRVGDARFHGMVANIAPPAPDILNIIFPTLLENHIKGTYIYGTPAWGSGALTNYMIAKMTWDPKLDAYDVQREWLQRAYGADAGKVMEQFYLKLNGWYRDYYQRAAETEKEGARYELTEAILKNIYAANYLEMEKLFLQAKAQPMTKIQSQRLQLIEDNLSALQWRLRNDGLLSRDLDSPLRLSDAQISDLIAEQNKDFALFPGVATSNDRIGRWPSHSKLPWKVLLSKKAESKNTLPKWQDDQILIHAVKDGEVRITTDVVKHDVYFAAYEITDSKGQLVTSGVFNTEKPVTFDAKSGESYMLTIPQRKPVNFQLQIAGSAVAQGHLRDGTLHLSAEEAAPIYVFYVPGKAPMGIFDDKGGVRVRKPYSGSYIKDYIASLTARGRYKEARLIHSFDSGWVFNADPQNDGLKRGVTKADFDDSSWVEISPLNWWNKQGIGFDDYSGPAWYRLKFEGDSLKKGEQARLFFGAIDGNAEIYLNGKKVGEHLLGKNYEGWDEAFTTVVTNHLKTGENILAVKVTSKPIGASGIHRPVALFAGTK